MPALQPTNAVRHRISRAGCRLPNLQSDLQYPGNRVIIAIESACNYCNSIWRRKPILEAIASAIRSSPKRCHRCAQQENLLALRFGHRPNLYLDHAHHHWRNPTNSMSLSWAFCPSVVYRLTRSAGNMNLLDHCLNFGRWLRTE